MIHDEVQEAVPQMGDSCSEIVNRMCAEFLEATEKAELIQQDISYLLKFKKNRDGEALTLALAQAQQSCGAAVSTAVILMYYF